VNPPVFTKFFTKSQTSITGANATVTVPRNTVD
jgi:hypothetical protein